LLENVVEGFTGPVSHAREPKAGQPKVTTQGLSREEFEALFLAHYSRIVSVLRRMLGDRGQAEELASEVFLKLYRQRSTLWPDGNVPGWLYRTATHAGIDALRAAARRNRTEKAAALDGQPNQSAESGLDQMLRAETQQRVRGVLADLKPPHAQLLLLRASGHSYKELAAALEIEVGSVGTMLIRAEAAFEKLYREIYGAEEDV
jgi:RNA polymerase sigma-70 factor (ECF subfamily)